MSFIKKNWPWMLVSILALIPILKILSEINLNFKYPDYDFLLFEDRELPAEIAQRVGRDVIPGVEIAIHETGEWAIRWLIAVLMLTPLKIVFGFKNNLFVRQALGIACGVYALFHGFFFFYHEGFFALFSEIYLVLGAIAACVILALTITSNRRSMKALKKQWKRLHRLVYYAAVLVVLHVAFMEKGWFVYAILIGLGFLIRWKPVRSYFKAKKLRLVHAN